MMITQTEVRRHPLWREEVASTASSGVPRRFARVAAVVVVGFVLALAAGLFALRTALPAA